MLWVNLVMDTFAATALSALPPSAAVMRDKPRAESDFIISGAMLRRMIPVSLIFCTGLLALLYVLEHAEVTCLADLFALRRLGPADGLTTRELTIFFNIFVLLQVWNLFNARAFLSGRSAFSGLGGCPAFTGTAVFILAGQAAIVTLGGRMFGVGPLPLSEWGAELAVTSVVLWLPEVFRLMRGRAD